MYGDDGLDDGLRMEWYECSVCESPYTWFNIQVMDGVMLVGWVHRIQVWKNSGGKCRKDRGMALHDMRLGTFETG